MPTDDDPRLIPLADRLLDVCCACQHPFGASTSRPAHHRVGDGLHCRPALEAARIALEFVATTDTD